MAHKLIVHASKKYREKQTALESELKAPRKIILWVIGLQIVEILMIGYLVYRVWLS